MDLDLELSPETLEILRQFKADGHNQNLKFEKLKQESEDAHRDLSIQDFTENWQLSQFWYTSETSEQIAKESIQETFSHARIGCIASPSVYTALKQLVSNRKCFVFEYDRRFEVFSDEFIFYDYNNPLEVEATFANSFDFLIIDPPFLSQECWSKVIQTARFLIKPGGKIMVCTGLVMTKLIASELGAHLCTFDIQHSNGLSNDFGCFLNYTSKNSMFVI